MGKRQTLRILADGRMAGGKKPRRGDTVACQICGTSFYRQPAYIKQNRRFCSPNCAHIGITKTPVIKSCTFCNIEMKLKPSQHARQYCSKACEAAARTKRPTGRQHNGRPVLINAAGYLTIYEPTHPAAARNGRVLEHRLVVERLLGRYLSTDEHVDHINRNKADNRPENLQVLTPSDHSRKTNGDRLAAQAEMLKRLAEYERRFGQLTND